MAVLGAAPGLHGDDALDLDLGPAPAHPDLVRHGQQLGELIVRTGQYLKDAGLVESGTSFEHSGPNVINERRHGTTIADRRSGRDVGGHECEQQLAQFFTLPGGKQQDTVDTACE